MQINATFASTATAGEIQAVDTAIGYLDSTYDVTQNVTFNMTFGTASLGSGTVAETVTNYAQVNYSDLESALYAKDTGPGSTPVQQAAALSLPTTDPTGGSGKFYASVAYARMLGLSVPSTSMPDATIDLNTGLNYTYSSAGGSTGGPIAPGTYDAVGALEHEITEGLGRTAFDGTKAFTGAGPDYTALDLFRYTASGVRAEPFNPNYNGTDQTYFSPDGKTIELPYDNATELAQGADVADWTSSVNNDSFGSGTAGQAGLISKADMDELQALGYALVCYASGTTIRAAYGKEIRDVAVEHLAIGDVIITASGAQRPIRWLGHRTVNCRNHPRPWEAMPIRIAAHAFGDNKPARDLFVSPGHSICVDVLGEVLMPASALVNGSTIRQIDVDRVTYWHVELDAHDIILADGLPAESYLEMGNRGFFQEAETTTLHGASPDAVTVTHDDFCRPFHREGALIAAVRERLLARARRLGWALGSAPLGDLHLRVDGTRLEPEVRGLSAVFAVPAGARDVWLCSTVARPSDNGDSRDGRQLGVMIASLHISDGFDDDSIIHDDPRLRVGFHGVETGGRWTSGRALLPAELWAGTGANGFDLRIVLAGPALPHWIEPLPTPAAQAVRVA